MMQTYATSVAVTSASTLHLSEGDAAVTCRCIRIFGCIDCGMYSCACSPCECYSTDVFNVNQGELQVTSSIMRISELVTTLPMSHRATVMLHPPTSKLDQFALPFDEPTLRTFGSANTLALRLLPTIGGQTPLLLPTLPCDIISSIWKARWHSDAISAAARIQSAVQAKIAQARKEPGRGWTGWNCPISLLNAIDELRETTTQLGTTEGIRIFLFLYGTRAFLDAESSLELDYSDVDWSACCSIQHSPPFSLQTGELLDRELGIRMRGGGDRLNSLSSPSAPRSPLLVDGLDDLLDHFSPLPDRRRSPFRRTTPASSDR